MSENDQDRNAPEASTSAVPAARNHTTGLPRLVLEERTRLGASATPEQIARALQDRGLTEATADAVREVWDEGHTE